MSDPSRVAHRVWPLYLSSAGRIRTPATEPPFVLHAERMVRTQRRLRRCRTATAVCHVVLALSLTLGAAHASGTPVTATAHRPRVALVLSGGGALGLAHIGVIQELERLGVHPDMVVGTSMGALVGGLYAGGMDGNELERAVTRMDWDVIFDPTPRRDNLRYRQKLAQAEFPVKASLGLKDGALKLPEALVLDQNLLLALRRLTPASAAVPTFDELPIPFRAVATDIESGKRVVLDHGELPMAMRSSMSVPGVFSAVPLNGQLLVDGGLADNLPIDVAREMGADVVIAVSIKSQLLDKSRLDSALAVLGQTTSLLIIANERIQLATLTPRDVLVTIDAGKLTAIDFNQSAALIEVGRRAVQAQIPALRVLAHSSDAPAQRPVAPLVKLAFIDIQNTSPYDDAVIEQRLAGLIGHPAEPEAIGAAMNRVYALGGFDRVDYTIATRHGRSGLVVQAQGQQSGKQRVRLGLSVANDFSASSDYGVSFDYRSGPLNGFGSELRLDGTFGDRNRLGAEYFHPLEPSQSWFVATRASGEARPVDVYTPEGFKRAAYDLRYGVAGADLGYQFGHTGEVRVGVERGLGQATLGEGLAQPASITIGIGRVFASAGLDTLDNPFFPRRGMRASARYTQGLTSLGSSSAYRTLSARGTFAASVGSHALLLGAAGGSSLDGDLPVDALFRLGGLFQLSGYHRDELSGAAFASVQLIYRYTMPRDEAQMFGVPLYVGASLEGGQTWARREDIDLATLRLGGSVYVAADTALGPVYLAYGQSEGGRGTAYLFIGKPF